MHPKPKVLYFVLVHPDPSPMHISGWLWAFELTSCRVGPITRNTGLLKFILHSPLKSGARHTDAHIEVAL